MRTTIGPYRSASPPEVTIEEHYETCGRVADRAVQVHGGSGFIRDFAVERFYRDVRLFRLYEGTSEIQKLIIAKDMIRGAS